LNPQVKLVLALVLAVSAIVSGSIGVTYISSNQGSFAGSQETGLTTFQTVVFLSTDTISAFTTETASVSTTLTRTSVLPVSTTQLVSSTSQLQETTSSTLYTSSASPTSSTISKTATPSYINSSSTTIESVLSSTSTTQSATNFTTTVTPQATLASISCSPSEFQLGVSSTCKVMVTGPYSGNTPTGTVSFVASRDGYFAPSDCTLRGNSDLASCSTLFSPFGSITGFYTISASYSGDPSHYGSTTNLTLIVYPAGATMVSCYPSSVEINVTTYCVATVTNSPDFPSPTGTVMFSSTGSGAFNPNSCALDSSGVCSVHYTPEKTGAGFTIITAAYGGDSIHAGGSGTFQLTVN